MQRRRIIVVLDVETKYDSFTFYISTLRAILTRILSRARGNDYKFEVVNVYRIDQESLVDQK